MPFLEDRVQPIVGQSHCGIGGGLTESTCKTCKHNELGLDRDRCFLHEDCPLNPPRAKIYCLSKGNMNSTAAGPIHECMIEGCTMRTRLPEVCNQHAKILAKRKKAGLSPPELYAVCEESVKAPSHECFFEGCTRMTTRKDVCTRHSRTVERRKAKGITGRALYKKGHFPQRRNKIKKN